MLLRRSMIAAAALLPLLSACTGPEMPYQSADGEARLSERLAGKVASAPVNCLPRYRTSEMEVIDRDTILFHDGSTVYRQDTNGQCYPFGRQAGYALVTRAVGGNGELCEGDIAQVVDTTSGFFAGSCSFNRFVPYRRAR